MGGYKSKHSKSFASKIKKTTLEYVNDLNKFYNRFNGHDFSKCVDHVKSNAFGNNSHFVCTNEQIHKEFKILESRRIRWYFTVSLKDVLRM